LKRIKKYHEPKSLEEYRNDTKTSNSYSEFKNKDAEQCKKDEEANKTNNLRRSLLNEQGYICCYNSKIEHFKPQSFIQRITVRL
jgi:FtsZ-interacting cell division protein YlmF